MSRLSVIIVHIGLTTVVFAFAIDAQASFRAKVSRDERVSRHASGFLERLASIVNPTVAKARRSATDNYRSVGHTVTAERAATFKVANVHRRNQDVKESSSRDDDSDQRWSNPEPRTLYPDPRETNPEIRSHGKPPPPLARDPALRHEKAPLPSGQHGRHRESSSASIFSDKETPPHLQFFHEHLLDLIQSVPAATEHAGANSRTFEDGTEVDRGSDTKGGYVRFPSDWRGATSDFRNEAPADNKKLTTNAKKESGDNENKGEGNYSVRKKTKLPNRQSANKKKAQQSTKKISTFENDLLDDDTDGNGEFQHDDHLTADGGGQGGPYGSSGENNMPPNEDPAGADGYQDQDHQSFYFPSGGSTGGVNDINVQIDVTPATPSMDSIPSQGDSQEDHDAIIVPDSPDHDGDGKPQFLGHSSAGLIQGTNAGSTGLDFSGLQIADDLGSVTNIGPSSHSSFGQQAPYSPPPYPKKGGDRHGMFVSNKVYESALSGIALLAFLTFLVNRIAQGVFVGGRRRRRRRSVVVTSDDDEVEGFNAAMMHLDPHPATFPDALLLPSRYRHLPFWEKPPLQHFRGGAVSNDDIDRLLQRFGLEDF